jgi:uronate dehydrogenase
MSVICLRIGSFEHTPTEPRHPSAWLRPRDMMHRVNCLAILEPVRGTSA